MPLAASEFRPLFMLDPAVVFLNHGSFGAVPRPVHRHQDALRRKMEAEPVRFLARELPDALDRVRESVAALVGAEPASIALTANTTTAVNAVARSVRLERGDEVLLTSHEYGAMRLLWDEVAAQAGARVTVADLPSTPRGDEELAACVLDRMTRRTRVVFCSHITSLTSTVLPIALICAEARRHGAISVVDGAHGPGQVDLDLPGIGADVYAGNAHKWLLAPRGAAFIHASESAREWIRGPVVSWGWTWAGEGAYQCRFAWPGTFDPTALLSIPAAIEFRRAHDWPAVVARCHTLAERTLAALVTEAGAVPTAAASLRPPQMVSAYLDIDSPQALKDDLWAARRIEIPVDQLGGATLIRLSVGAYTTDAECDLLVAAVAQHRAQRRAPRPA
ncbi:MAG TPA: aminotransferase class V-fold PLP-dependent enzyme [Gaiellales bacterium]